MLRILVRFLSSPDYLTSRVNFNTQAGLRSLVRVHQKNRSAFICGHQTDDTGAVKPGRHLFYFSALRHLLYFALCGLLSACASFQSVSKLELSQDAIVKIGESNAVEKKAGDVLDISEQVIFIKAEGKVPILVVPVQATTSLKIDPPLDTHNFGLFGDKTNLSEIVRHFAQAQVLFFQKQPARALQILDDLQRVHPQLIYLNFLKSSCLISLGQQSAALIVLEEALRVYPDDPQGQKLYEALKQREKTSPPAPNRGNKGQ